MFRADCHPADDNGYGQTFAGAITQAQRPQRRTARTGGRAPSAGDDETFNPTVRLNEDSLIEIQPSAEFSRGLLEALVERLQASAAFDLYEQAEEGGDLPDGVDYVVRARVIAIGLQAHQGEGRANKLCRWVKCSKSVRDTLSRIKLNGERVTFTVKVAVSAAEAQTKRIAYAGSFSGKATVQAHSLKYDAGNDGDDEGALGVKVLRSPAASEAAHQALDQAVAALARRFAVE